MWQIQTHKGFRFAHRLLHFPIGFIRFIRHFFKWIFTGRCDHSIWDFDVFITNIIVDRLTVFISWIDKGITTGYPHGLKDKKEWRDILVKMRDGFIEIRDETVFNGFEAERVESEDEGICIGGKCTKMTDESKAEFLRLNEKHNKIRKETLDLFKEYYGALWS